MGRREVGASTTIVVIAVVLIIAVGGVGYYALTTSNSSSTPTTSQPRSATSASSTQLSTPSQASSVTTSTSLTSPSTTVTTSTAKPTTPYTSTTSTSSSAQASVCGKPAQGAHTVNVGMPSESVPFQPETITVVIGVNSTVIWTNTDVNGIVHTVTSNTAGQFDSGDLSQGQTFTCAFTVAGTYGYHCIYHPGMIGKVIVKSA